MRIYSQADEEKIRAQSLVHEWRRSGFLDASELAQLSSELRVGLSTASSAVQFPSPSAPVRTGEPNFGGGRSGGAGASGSF